MLLRIILWSIVVLMACALVYGILQSKTCIQPPGSTLINLNISSNAIAITNINNTNVKQIDCKTVLKPQWVECTYINLSHINCTNHTVNNPLGVKGNAISQNGL